MKNLLEYIREYKIKANKKERNVSFVTIGEARDILIITDDMANIPERALERMSEARITFIIINKKVRRKEQNDCTGGIYLFKDDLTIFGTVKKKSEGEWMSGAQDLLINTIQSFSYPAEYIVRCSNARFKCGFGPKDNDALDFGVIVIDGRDPKAAIEFLFDSLDSIG